MFANVEADAEIELTPKKSKDKLAGDQVVDVLTKVYRLEYEGKMEAASKVAACNSSRRESTWRERNE